MNIIYEFTNLKIEVAPILNGNESVITRISYTYQATDTESGKFAGIEGYHDFELAEGSVFTPFSSLTESTVKSWLETKVSTEGFVAILETKVADEVLSMYVSVDAPWQITETVTSNIITEEQISEPMPSCDVIFEKPITETLPPPMETVV